MQNVVCPISNIQINSYAARAMGFVVTVAVSLYLYTGNPYIMIALAADFLFRTFLNVKFSPISYLISLIFKTFNLPKKPTDKAPKVFAARLGFTLSALTASFFYINMNVSIAFAIILVICSSLEAFFDYCLGCVIYHKIVLPFYKD